MDNRTAWTSKNYHWNTRDGGFVGWGQRPWTVAARLATQDGPAVRLTYTSKDGDMVRRAGSLLAYTGLRAQGRRTTMRLTYTSKDDDMVRRAGSLLG